MLRQHVTCFVRDVIPSALGGSDVLATAETGTWVESNAEVNSSLWNGHQASPFHLKILKEKLHVGKLVLNVLLSVLSCISWLDRFRQDGLILVANARAPVSGRADNADGMTAAI